jgi:drug/metabolite transporter (DMT)-like permease
MDRRSWSMLLVLAAIWGASYLFIKVGVRDFPPAAVAWLRVLLAALVLVPIAAYAGGLRGVRGHLPLLLIVGAIQVAGPFLLIAAGEQEISSALAGILVASTPLFAAVLAIWVDHEERSQGLRLVGVLLGIAGVAALLGLDLGDSGAALLGGAAIVLASLGYAIGGFLVKHRLAEVAPIGLAAWVMVASSLLLAPPALASIPAGVPSAGPVAAVIALGVLGTGVAFAIFYTLMARVGPARTFVVTYLAPVFAVFYGATLLDEPLGVATFAGLGLILAGSWLAAEGRIPGLSAARRPAPPPCVEAAPSGSAPLPAPSAARRASPLSAPDRSHRPIRADREAS